MSMITGHIRTFRYNISDHVIIRDFDFKFESNRISCLVGGSGVGKTTLVKVLLGIHSLSKKAGTISYHMDGSILTPTGARSSGFVGAIFQDSTLVPWLNVEKNLYLPWKLNNKLRAPSNAAITDIFESLGLSPRVLSKLPHELSFGMQQRVTFARMVLYSPKYLFLDEIFNGLDTLNADALLSETKQYVLNNEATCLLVTHDIDRALKVADVLLFQYPTGEIVNINLPTSRESVVDLLKTSITYVG